MNNALRKARKAADLTKQELECLAGLTRGSIHDLESGRTKSPAYPSGVRILTVLASRGVDRKLLDRIFPVNARRASHAPKRKGAAGAHPVNGVERRSA